MSIDKAKLLAWLELKMKESSRRAIGVDNPIEESHYDGHVDVIEDIIQAINWNEFDEEE
jgi:hypothetical protein